MMPNLVIIGASAMGRETYRYAVEANPSVQVKGFLDSRKDILDGYDGYPPIIGDVSTYQPGQNDVFICAVGNPDAKMEYVRAIETKGGSFTSIIHPTAYVASSASIGIGAIIAPNASITADTTLGSHVIVNVNASISHDCFVGTGVSISPGCHIAGWCRIANGTFLGTGVTAIPHVTIGGNGRTLVAAGATVTQSFGSGLIAGVPAKFKKELCK